MNEYEVEIRINDNGHFGKFTKKIEAPSKAKMWASLIKMSKDILNDVVSITIIKEPDMHIHAKSRLAASREDPTSSGVAFDTLTDGKPTDEEPIVQEVTNDDGPIENYPAKHLLMDDLPV